MKDSFAVLRFDKGTGNDSGMTPHIERRDADGKRYIPDNTDPSRAHLNRELIAFPEGIANRTDAILHRLQSVGIKRKISKNQVTVIRAILTGSPDQMKKIEEDGRLDEWCDANLKWLNDTFGSENVVSCVLHMDETTPHLHATITPIVYGPRPRRKREGEVKYGVKSGPRLCCNEIMTRRNLIQFQDTYGAAMRAFGLRRGVEGSLARHTTCGQWYRNRFASMNEDIADLESRRNETMEEYEKSQMLVKEKQEQLQELQKRLKMTNNDALKIAKGSVSSVMVETMANEFINLLPSLHEISADGLFEDTLLKDMAVYGNSLLICAWMLFNGYVDNATEFAQTHGGGGSEPELPWRRKEDEDDLRWAKRCLHQARKLMQPPIRRSMRR